MPKTQHKCPCLREVPEGIRSGPNSKVWLEANPKCSYCGGDGLITVSVSHDPPPVPFRNCDWNATVDGCDESGPMGYGPTATLAVQDLLIRIEEAIN